MKWKINQPIRIIIDEENQCLKLIKDKDIVKIDKKRRISK
jgi:hypothetical protein